MIKNVHYSSHKVPVFLVRLMKHEFSLQIFEKKKLSNIKFNKNRSSGSRIASCGQTNGGTSGQTGITKVIAAFRKFANVPTNTLTNKITHSS